MAVKNKRLTEEEFFKERQQVLAMWPTGQEIDLDEAVAFHKTLPPGKNYALKAEEAKKKGDIMIITMTGVPTLEGHIDLLKYTQDHGHVDLLWTMIDSLTRTCQFEAAQRKLEESLRTGHDLLNGFPIVAHGTKACRKIAASVEMPIIVGGNAPDWRLVTETGIASGHTAIASGPMISFANYSKTVPLETSIHNFQYCFRLMGYYAERGVPIISEPGGAITTLTPPAMIVAMQLVEVMIAAEQGVKCVNLFHCAQGSLVQDVVTAATSPKIIREYLDKFGHNDVTLNSVATAGTLIWPQDQAQCYAALCMCPMIAVLSGAQVASIKTIDEAATIPTRENNAASTRTARMMLELLKDQKIDLMRDPAAQTEAEMLVLEARTIIDRVLDLGDGDIAVGAIKAVEQGVLDVSFATNQYLAKKVMGVRDSQGAVRYFDSGNVPLKKESLEYHRAKLAERENARGRKLDYQTIIDDVCAISRGGLVID